MNNTLVLLGLGALTAGVVIWAMKKKDEPKGTTLDPNQIRSTSPGQPTGSNTILSRGPINSLGPNWVYEDIPVQRY